MMRVEMVTRIGGYRNGEAWPEPGHTIEVPDHEARDLIAAGYAKEATDAAPASDDEPPTPDGPVDEPASDDEPPTPDDEGDAAGEEQHPQVRPAKPARKRAARKA